ncbi:hypothetical protein ACLOJK_004631 [Asimina triloba]
MDVHHLLAMDRWVAEADGSATSFEEAAGFYIDTGIAPNILLIDELKMTRGACCAGDKGDARIKDEALGFANDTAAVHGCSIGALVAYLSEVKRRCCRISWSYHQLLLSGF